ncbi:MAG: hypothetical protein Q7S17_01975 [Xanthobacteraceae bacterium]|nr:hypothetical protein [Xanthobacteraceae bacterium]
MKENRVTPKRKKPRARGFYDLSAESSAVDAALLLIALAALLADLLAALLAALTRLLRLLAGLLRLLAALLLTRLRVLLLLLVLRLLVTHCITPWSRRPMKQRIDKDFVPVNVTA